MHLFPNLGGGFVARVGIYEAWQLPLTLVMLLTAVFTTRYPIALFDRFENLIGKIADRPYLSAVLIAGVTICARLAPFPFIGTPQPILSDEVKVGASVKAKGCELTLLRRAIYDLYPG
jgi:hypothetical protein